MSISDQEIVDYLRKGKIGVIPTDTTYGICGSAQIQKTVEKIYRLRKRSPEKPMIILIGSLDDLKMFNIKLSIKQKIFLQKIWPNPISVALPCAGKKFEYLHRGTNSLAFRVPNNQRLLQILQKAGPLVAPSANFEGNPPAQTIDEAKKYFGDDCNFYIDRGRLNTLPSTLIELETDGSYKILREGGFKLTT